MRIYLRSRILSKLGTLLLGDPSKKKFGESIYVSPQEFYALEIDRRDANPTDLNPESVKHHATITRNVIVSQTRISVFNSACLVATIICAGGLLLGNAGAGTINGVKSGIHKISNSFSSKEDKAKRMQELQKEAEDLQAKTMTGQITQEEFLKRQEELQNEYKQLGGK